MAQARITNDTPKIIDIADGADLLDLDGTTKLADNAFRRIGVKSPYGRGSELRGDTRWARREFAIDLDGDGPDSRRTVLVWVPETAIDDPPEPAPIDPNPALQEALNEAQTALTEAQADLARIADIALGDA